MLKKVTVRQLFPNRGDEQIERIADVLHNYANVAWRIYERLEREHPEIIDELMNADRMKGKVDSSNHTN